MRPSKKLHTLLAVACDATYDHNKVLPNFANHYIPFSFSFPIAEHVNHSFISSAWVMSFEVSYMRAWSPRLKIPHHS